MQDRNNTPSGDSFHNVRSRMASIGLDPVEAEPSNVSVEHDDFLEVIESPATFVLRQLTEGRSPQHVAAQLTLIRGEEYEETAATLVDEAAAELSRARRSRRRQHLWTIGCGAVLGVAGVGVTLGTMAIAGPGEAHLVTIGLFAVAGGMVIKGALGLANAGQ